MKHYRIEITGVGPASNGKPDTAADLLLQALLATLKSVGHKISKALIMSMATGLSSPMRRASPCRKKPCEKRKGGGAQEKPLEPGNDTQPSSSPAKNDPTPEGTTGQAPPQTAPDSATGNAPQTKVSSSASAPASAPTSEES